MRKLVKYAVAVVVILFPVLGAHAQQEKISAKHHPGEHLRYSVTFEDGEVNKITGIQMSFSTSAAGRPDQPNGGTQFGSEDGNCQKSIDPKTWNCDLVIPKNIVDGDYNLFQVVAGTTVFGKIYHEDFHVPMVSIENYNTFAPPSRVTVKQQP